MPTENDENRPAKVVPRPRSGPVWAIVGLASVGAFLAGGSGGDDRVVARFRAHLDVLQGQLADLAELLREHKAAHGRYPTNDEGLAALDGYEARFRVRYVSYRRGPHDGFSGFPQGYIARFWPRAKQAILEYRASHGHVPKNAEELNQTALTRGVLLPEGAEPPIVPAVEEVAEAELAITKSGDLLLLGQGGALTPWLVPYLYENRVGLPASAFGDSPCNRDSRRRFSVRVDDGVFVYTTGGQLFASEYDASWWEYYGPRMAGAAMLLAAAFCVALLWRAWRWRAVYGIIAIVASAFAGVMATYTFPPTRQRMSAHFAWRDPQMVVRQLELLEKYRDRGVISEEAFRKAAAYLDNLLTSPKAEGK